MSLFMYIKKTLWLFSSLFVLLSISCTLQGQDMPRTVIGSTGDYYDNLLFGTLHFTVGEVAVARYQNGLELGEGFHRAYYDLIVESKEILPVDWEVNIYPNPTTERIRIALPNEESTSAELYNSNGQLLFRQAVLETDQELDLGAYPAGTYLLRLQDQTGRQGTFRVLKVKY